MRTENHQVACEPFPSNSVVVSSKKGFATVENKETLYPLMVVMDTADGKYNAGQTIYVHGDVVKHVWAMKKYSIASTEFILVPYEFLVLVA